MALESSVLILGAGINGAALARELVLNEIPVVVVDTRDIAAGTTAYSSRLIHGGLRYLEHGDFDLVRESLAERTRWLQLAPHLVRPLRLYIPVENRFGGLLSAARMFIGITGKSKRDLPPKRRGLVTIRSGLWLYDRYARDLSLPRYAIHRADQSDLPPVDRRKFRWLCEYSDAQLIFPERLTLELLLDAKRLASEYRVDFRVLTYHQARFAHGAIQIDPVDGRGESLTIRPAAIVNATGAWVDHTLAELHIPSKRLLGGTKGSHFVTSRADLGAALGGRGIYAEASDGRPIFILPFGSATLVGTTDEPYEGDPDAAVASPEELAYLRGAVHEVFPQISLSEADVDMHYSGVRPLPFVGPATPAAITRRHWLEEHAAAPLLFFSIIGGKLTTCRSLAEEATAAILHRLGESVRRTSRDRPLDGDEQIDRAVIDQFHRGEISPGDQSPNAPGPLLDATAFPVALAHEMVEREWVRRLDDFVERRLMLLYHRRLTRRCLAQLADVLVAAGRLDAQRRAAEIERVIHRLQSRFGKRVHGTSAAPNAR